MSMEFGSLEMVALACVWLCGVTTGVLLASWAVDRRESQVKKAA